MSLPRSGTALWIVALAASASILWLGSRDVYWSDYGMEAAPAFDALIAGDLRAFLLDSPAYAGSMTLRAPLVYAAGVLGGDANWVFRAGALPGALLLAWLAVSLAGQAARSRLERTAPLLALLLVAAGPVAWWAYSFGHPEDILAASASVAAVLVARTGRTLVAGALVGVAVASKQWAVLAVVPALLAAPKMDLRMLLAAVAVPAALVAPVWLADAGGFTAEVSGAARTGNLFHPQTVWWPLVEYQGTLPSGDPRPVPPAWLNPVPKPLIVLLGLGLSLLWARRARSRPWSDALLLLAVLFLLRCILDPWNLGYYHVPFVLALVAWEVHDGRRPIMSLAATALVLGSFHVYDARTGVGPFLTYMAWTIPLLAGLGLRLVLGPERFAALGARGRLVAA